jgi:hypothetical protein
MKTKYISPEFEVVELRSMKLMSTSDLENGGEQEEVTAESKSFGGTIFDDEQPWE